MGWFFIFTRVVYQALLWLGHRGCGLAFTVGITWDPVCEHEIRISWCLHTDEYHLMFMAVHSAIYKHRIKCVYSIEGFPCIKNTSFLFDTQVFDLQYQVLLDLWMFWVQNMYRYWYFYSLISISPFIFCTSAHNFKDFFKEWQCFGTKCVGPPL